MDWLDNYLDELFSPTEEGYNLEPLYELLRTSSYEGHDFADMEYRIMGITSKEEYGVIWRDLMNCQTDPITSGRNYNMGDIKRHLRKLK